MNLIIILERTSFLLPIFDPWLCNSILNIPFTRHPFVKLAKGRFFLWRSAHLEPCASVGAGEGSRAVDIGSVGVWLMSALLSAYGIRTSPTFGERVARLQSGGGNNVETVYNEFLKSDMKDSALPCLPSGMASRHLETLKGLYVLQVTSVKNVGASKEEREKGDLARGKRSLMFCFTDGAQDVVGVEFEPLRNLKLSDIAHGTKFAVQNVLVRRGIMLLTAGNLKRLGGAVAPPATAPVAGVRGRHGGGGRGNNSRSSGAASGSSGPGVANGSGARKRRRT